MTQEVPPGSPSEDRLDSWKEIAAHLKRGVTTVQRWEKDEGMPVHRLPHARAGSVYAWRSEVDAWWHDRSLKLESELRRRPMARLLVLPFQNLSSDPDQEYLADGLTEELITQLAQRCQPGLAVLARTTAMVYKGTRKRVREIADDLGLDYVIEGSIRRSGDKVRIAAQLINAHDETHRWAAVRDRSLGDLLMLQAEVAEAVAREVTTVTTPATILVARRQARRVSGPAYDAYLRGLHTLFTGVTQEAIQKSLILFRQAIDAEPDFAPAHVGLAHAYQMLGGAGINAVPPGEVEPKARQAALRALQIDDSLGEAHTALGVILWQYDWDWSAAEHALRRGVELSPSHAMAYIWLAACLHTLGRCDESIAACRRAKDVDPLSPMVQMYLVCILASCERVDQAEEEARLSLESYPEHWIFLYGVSFARMAAADFRGAVEVLRRCDRLCPGNPNVMSWLGHNEGRVGLREDANRVLDGLLQASRERYVPPWAIANVYVGLGDSDRAFEWLEKALDERSGWFVGLRSRLCFGLLFGDPRYEALCRRVGL